MLWRLLKSKIVEIILHSPGKTCQDTSAIRKCIIISIAVRISKRKIQIHAQCNEYLILHYQFNNKWQLTRNTFLKLCECNAMQSTNEQPTIDKTQIFPAFHVNDVDSCMIPFFVFFAYLLNGFSRFVYRLLHIVWMFWFKIPAETEFCLYT